MLKYGLEHGPARPRADRNAAVVERRGRWENLAPGLQHGPTQRRGGRLRRRAAAALQQELVVHHADEAAAVPERQKARAEAVEAGQHDLGRAALDREVQGLALKAAERPGALRGGAFDDRRRRLAPRRLQVARHAARGRGDLGAAAGLLPLLPLPRRHPRVGSEELPPRELRLVRAECDAIARRGVPLEAQGGLAVDEAEVDRLCKLPLLRGHLPLGDADQGCRRDPVSRMTAVMIIAIIKIKITIVILTIVNNN